MKKQIPKIIAAHDLSGYGTASLTAVIPILSAMGSYVCPLQTAALSTVTGIFDGYTFVDLTRNMKDTVNHWASLGFSFDCIYSGFLGNTQQVDIIIDAKEKFNCPLIVDPVFADDGKLYPSMGDSMVSEMKRLVSHADIITPNITEAMFLLGEKNLPKTKYEICGYLKRLCDIGPKLTIITSCKIDDKMYVCAYDREKDEYIFSGCAFYDGSFHGTGDIFTTVLTGAIMRGDGTKEAIELAVEFVRLAIEKTVENRINPKEGVAIQNILSKLIRTDNSCGIVITGSSMN